MTNINPDLLKFVHNFILFNDLSTKEIPIDKLLQSRFFEFEIDSLEIMELIIEIEDRYSIRINDEIFVDRDDETIDMILLDITKIIDSK